MNCQRHPIKNVRPIGTPPYSTKEIAMNKLVFALAGINFSASVHAQSTAASSTSNTAAPAASTCEAKAVGKNGKPLAGAAKAAFIKKCEGGNTSGKTSSCATKAVDKNGKPLAGAAKTSFMKKCEADTAK